LPLRGRKIIISKTHESKTHENDRAVDHDFALQGQKNAANLATRRVKESIN